jgi:hypothetical protein
MATPAQKKLVQKRLADIRLANNAQSKGFKWTGFSDKTLWDWIGLVIQIIGAIAVPASIIVGLYTFSVQQRNDNANNLRQEMDNAKLVDAQQQEMTLQTYLNDMTTLLFDDKLGGQAPTSAEAAVIARSKTLLTLSRLPDPQRKAEVVHFLHDSHLIGYLDNNHIKHPAIVDLSDADLSNADLSNADLSGATLSFANLNHANLNGAFLAVADLSNADLSYTELSNAELSRAFLVGIDLTNANLSDADLSYADLRRAALLCTQLHGATLTGAVLDGALMGGALVTNEQLAQAKSLKGVIIPAEKIYTCS